MVREEMNLPSCRLSPASDMSSSQSIVEIGRMHQLLHVHMFDANVAAHQG